MKSTKKLLEEASKRNSVKPFSIKEFCFDKQLSFIEDTARFKTAVCSRRSGKSFSCAGDLIDTARKGPHHNVAYITLSRTSAKRIIWPILKQIIKDYKIAHTIDNTELVITLDSGSSIYLMGAKDLSEIEKLRGLSLKKVYIDEAQSFRESVITPLIDDVLSYATMDVSGSICLIGTPGPIPAGYFYTTAHNKKWSNHKWTIFDNPWIKIKSGKTAEELLKEERERRGITENDATYRRESLGEWVNDTNALVLKFDRNKNIYIQLPQGEYEYIFGIDIGWNDADSISVLAFSRNRTEVYLVEEHIKTKQTISELVDAIKVLQKKYNPIKMVMDAGALGKKIQEEIRDRHHLHLDAADKNRKFEFLELLNDDLRTGRFKAFPNSVFEEDCSLVEWDRKDPNKLKISDSYHSDSHDSTLYAWRECRNFVPINTRGKFSINSIEYAEQEEERLMEEFEQKKRSSDLDPNIEDLEFISGTYDDEF